MIDIFLLMFADNMVITAELDPVWVSEHVYTKERHLNVNASKTKTVIFRSGGKISDHKKWVYSEQQVEFTNTFRYLSMLFNFNGKCVVKQGNNAHFAISNHLFNIETMSCF